MKKMYAVVALAMGVTGSSCAWAQEAEQDSAKVSEMHELVVSAVRAQKYAPFAVTNINQTTLEEFGRKGQELPMLFSRTPGVLAWSENGLGTGTVYMSMRGAASSRVNVTLDGVCLNSPEDQTVFWANMNSYATLLGGAQIQRGVGTSTNGDGAFGGTIALTTKSASLKPSLELTGNYGSYNTYNVGGNFSTGLLWNHLVVDGAYHHTGTDGYVHGTSGNSGSYYGGLTWMNTDRNFQLSYKNIGNYEHTGQAWNGIDTHELLDWNYGGMGTGIMGFKDIYNAGMGKYNSLYEYMIDEYDPSKGYGRYEMADGTLWERTTDNFKQNHNILSATWQIDSKWSLNAALHYTYGYGYYDEFRSNNKLSKFGLANYTLSDGSTLKKTDFVRQKGLEQNAFGANWNVNYKGEKWNVIGGMALQMFNGNHFGYLTYIKNEELRQAVMKGGDKYTYYDSDARKNDHSMYVKASYDITRSLSVFGDLQYRYVSYYTNGINDKFVGLEDGTYANQQLLINEDYHFVNPKAGLNYHKGGHKAYASWAMSNREPERNNYTDNGKYPAPKPERVNDYELGYSYQGSMWNVGANLYYMDYKDQFVKTGELSDIGEALTTNIKSSHRMGVELNAGVRPVSWLNLEANAALSQNKVKDFDEVVEDWDNGSQTIHYDNTTLALSPSVVLNGFADFMYKGFKATWHTGYVGRQYLDNTECKERSLDAFTRTDINLSYRLNVCEKGLKEVNFGLDLNNIFNSHYAANGWVYSAIYASGGNPNSSRYTEIGYVPSAGFTLMGHVTLKF